MCSGDTTLEWPSAEEGVGVDGWGISHQCKDWEGLIRWQREHGV